MIVWDDRSEITPFALEELTKFRSLTRKQKYQVAQKMHDIANVWGKVLVGEKQEGQAPGQTGD